MHVIMSSHTCSKWNWMVYQEIYASGHFQVDASSITLLRALSQMIRMKTCQSLSTRPSIGQEISMPWAPSQFWLGAIKPPRFNKKRTSASPICVYPLCVFHLHRVRTERVHNRFGGMRNLAIFRGDTRNASWKQERDAGISITSGSGISYSYGDGMRESQGIK